MESQYRGLYHSAANGPQEVTLARYIPLSANRRLIIINHYPVYRLCVRTRMRLSLSLRYASPRRPVVCAHLTYPRKGGGEASARTFTYVLEISRSSAEALSLLLRHRDLPIAFRYGHFERQDRSYPTFSPSILLFASLAPSLRFFSTPPPRLRRSFSLINRWRINIRETNVYVALYLVTIRYTMRRAIIAPAVITNSSLVPIVLFRSFRVWRRRSLG